MQHRIYNLTGGQTVLGIEMSDIALGIFTWLIGNFLYGELLHPRLAMIATILTIAGVVTCWRLFKDRLPPGFFRHFIPWVTEANVYRIGIDRTHRPAVVDHQRVLAHLEHERNHRKGAQQHPVQGAASTRLKHGIFKPNT